MWQLVAERGCSYVLMHRRGDARTMNSLAHYSDVVAEVEAELLQLCEQLNKLVFNASRSCWILALALPKPPSTTWS